MKVALCLVFLFSLCFAGPECPVGKKCPYYTAHKGEHQAGQGCPLEKGGCPYFDKHSKDHTVGDIVAADVDAGCPMAKCPYYEKMKSGEAPTEWTTSNCPLAEKCPYYQKVKESPEKLKDCPLAGACPHFKDDHGSADKLKKDAGKCPHLSQKHGKSECPVGKKCPYYTAHKGEHQAGQGCPLEKGGCPYFDKHSKDHTVGDIVAADVDAGCPMAKCPYYEKMKSGEAPTEWTTSNCPLAEKCPYYQKVKESPEKLKDCPLAGACPHFKDDHGSADKLKKDAGKCPHLSQKHGKSECPVGKKCPYYTAHKGEHQAGQGCPLEKGGCPYFDKHSKDHTVGDIVAADVDAGCPMAKCPYYEKMKSGEAPTEWTTSNCPLAEKCPYYQKVKESPEKLKDCPLAGACPHFKDDHGSADKLKKDAGKCPHLSTKPLAETKKESKSHEDL